MSREYSPDNWILLKIENDGKTFFKILGGWRGGYLHGDSWRMSSIVESIEEDDRNYIFHNYSGSKYICNKQREGLSMVTSGVFSDFVNQVNEAGGKIDMSNVEDFVPMEKDDEEK